MAGGAVPNYIKLQSFLQVFFNLLGEVCGTICKTKCAESVHFLCFCNSDCLLSCIALKDETLLIFTQKKKKRKNPQNIAALLKLQCCLTGSLRSGLSFSLLLNLESH